MKTILDPHKFNVVIERLSHQLIENHGDFSNTVLIGIQPRGIHLSDRVVAYLRTLVKTKLQYGKLDITFYRDDFNTGGAIHMPNQTEINFSIEDKKVIFARYGQKLLGGFSKEKLTQLKSNVELYTKLTEY